MRLKMTIALAALLILLAPDLWARPRTPVVYVNRKYKLVELAKGQRATVQFDLRPIAGEHLKLNLYRHDQTLDEKPVKEWLIHSATGPHRISFDDLPLAVYLMVAFCSNEEGEQLAYAAPLIHVEYGGWRAWQEFKPPVETVEGAPAAFEDLEVATSVRNRDVGIGVDPPAVLIKPGQTATFFPAFREMEPEPLNWSLVGEGTLEKTEDGGYLYTAPANQIGTKLFRIEVQSVAHPDLKGGATILVTTADPDRLQ